MNDKQSRFAAHQAERRFGINATTILFLIITLLVLPQCLGLDRRECCTPPRHYISISCWISMKTACGVIIKLFIGIDLGLSPIYVCSYCKTDVARLTRTFAQLTNPQRLSTRSEELGFRGSYFRTSRELFEIKSWFFSICTHSTLYFVLT
jgi:hypothetical protein